jgi:hypothetical protein
MLFQVMTGLRFIVLWVIGGMVTLVVTLMAAFFALVVLSIILGFFYVSGSNTASLVMQLTVIGAFGVVGAVMGFASGSVQKSVMSQKYDAEFRGWRRLSTFGGAVGLMLSALALSVPIKKMLLTLTLPDPRVLLFYGVLPIIIPLLCMGIAQWFVLSRYVAGAWAWILANVVAALVLYSLLMGLFTSGTAILIVPVLLAVAAPTIVTGFALLWLFQFNAHDTFPDEFY